MICSPPAIVVRVPRAALHLKVACTPAQRERGLMGVRVLPKHSGMLFVFPADARVAFWMKDTLVPLDMVFIAADGTVRSIAARVPTVPPETPDDRIPLRFGRARYVIELPAGESSRDGIATGVHLGGLPAGTP